MYIALITTEMQLLDEHQSTHKTIFQFPKKFCCEASSNCAAFGYNFHATTKYKYKLCLN